MADEQSFGKFRIVRRIARGGMAEVFLARLVGDGGFQKSVVLKRILPHLSADPDFTRMFTDEAVLAAKLTHPNVAQVYEFGEIDDTYYIAMEYVDGADLRKLIRAAVESKRALTPAEVAAIGEGMARGLSYVHSAEDEDGRQLCIVHRDISPHNVMLSRTGEVKIMDFGIAKAAERVTHTATGMIKGKMAYMAPEQALGEEVDKLSDQFAVGLVLWECLVGERMFEGDSDPVVLSRVAAGRVRRLKDFAPNVPDALERIIMRALNVERERRYPDLRDLEQDLSNYRWGLGPAGAVKLSALVDELAPREPTGPLRERGTLALPVGEVGSGSGGGQGSGIASGSGAGSNSGVSATAHPGSPAEPAPDHPSSPSLSSPSLSMQSGWTRDEATAPTRMPIPNRAPEPFTATHVAEVAAGPEPKGHRRELRGVGVAIAAAAVTIAAVFVMRNGGTSEATLMIESDPPGAALLVSATPDAPPLSTGLVTPAPIRGHAAGDTVRWRVELAGMAPQERTTKLTDGMQHEKIVLEKLPEAAPAVPPDSSPTTTPVAPAPTQPEPTPGTRAKQAAKTDKPKKQPTGYLSLRVNDDWANVYLNRKLIGRATFDRLEVPAGHLKLELRGPNGVTRNITVDVPADGWAAEVVDMK